MARKSYQEIAQVILNYIEEQGYHTYKVTYDEYSKNYVTFRIKELNKHWVFGMYIYNKTDKMLPEKIPYNCKECAKYYEKHKDEYIQISLFTQFDKDIDKFKYSRSYYKTQFNFYDINEYVNDTERQHNFFFEIKDILEEIKKHPYVARVYSGCYCEPPYTTPFKAFRVCIKWEWDAFYSNIKKRYNHFRVINKLKYYKFIGKIKSYQVIDQNEKWEGLIISPRYNVNILSPIEHADYIDETMEKFVNNIPYYDSEGYHIYTYDTEEIKEVGEINE